VKGIAGTYFTGNASETFHHRDTEAQRKSLILSLYLWDIGEYSFLPIVRREVPVAGAGLVIVPTV
jgi:hypothetical protein